MSRRRARCATRSSELLPADAAVFVAAVADWRTEQQAGEKIKKVAGEGPPALKHGRKPGHPRRHRPSRAAGPIWSSASPPRPEACCSNAEAKLKKKGADFIVANDVSQSGVMGGDRNRVAIVAKAGVDDWPELTKDEVAARLAALIADRLKTIEV